MWACARGLAFEEQFIGSTMLDLVVTHAEVPEPGTWMLMILGFAGIGLAGRGALHRDVRSQPDRVDLQT